MNFSFACIQIHFSQSNKVDYRFFPLLCVLLLCVFTSFKGKVIAWNTKFGIVLADKLEGKPQRKYNSAN